MLDRTLTCHDRFPREHRVFSSLQEKMCLPREAGLPASAQSRRLILDPRAMVALASSGKAPPPRRTLTHALYGHVKLFPRTKDGPADRENRRQVTHIDRAESKESSNYSSLCYCRPVKKKKISQLFLSFCISRSPKKIFEFFVLLCCPQLKTKPSPNASCFCAACGRNESPDSPSFCIARSRKNLLPIAAPFFIGFMPAVEKSPLHTERIFRVSKV